MRLATIKSICALTAVAAACAAGGCASGGGQASWNPFSNRKNADDAEYANTPARRMEDLEALVESAPQADAAEQERVSALLAQNARGELDPLVRAQVVRTLGHYRTAAALAAVSAGLQDAESGVRVAACESLGLLKGPQATQLLSETIASDTDPDVRLAALRAAGELADPNAMPGVAVALEDSDPALQFRAIRSLEKLSGKYYGNDVNLWREYVAGASPAQPAMPVAERVRRLF